MKNCKVCKQKMQVKFIPKGKVFLWKTPNGIKSEWVRRREFSLGSDYITNRDLRYLFCSCGYEMYEEADDE